uniref:E3 ubiquitin-protein ligase RNF103 n=1 Tax=Cacopsylla melanoneura TaxID=428564 RepID=A0A8D8PU91_9HEMI
MIQVIPASHKHQEPLLDDYSWRYLQHHLAPFAVQMGVFDCGLDKELCLRRNWLEPILLLALPRGNRPKDHVVIRTSNTPKVHMIIKWVKEQLSSRVEKISSLSELEEDWLTHNQSDDGVKVVLFSHFINTPLFFAALSIKFTGRIKFGIFSVKKDEDESPNESVDAESLPSSSSNIRKYLMDQHRILSLPTYLVISPHGKHMYGSLPGEHFNLLRMNLLLKAIVPEMNDVFIVALVLTNMLTVIQICQIQGSSSWLYLIHASFLVITSNLFLFISSLILYNISIPLPVSFLLSLLHSINFSLPGALLRSDLFYLYRHPALFIASFVLYGFLTAKLFRFSGAPWYEWELLPWGNSFIVNSLFRPSETPSRHFSSDTIFDLRFEQLVISRSPRVFNVPNLWLQPPPPVDYISDLPVFEYKGWRPCPHKEMGLLERVMDGDNPRLLHRTEGPRGTAEARPGNMSYDSLSDSDSGTDRLPTSRMSSFRLDSLSHTSLLGDRLVGVNMFNNVLSRVLNEVDSRQSDNMSQSTHGRLPSDTISPLRESRLDGMSSQMRNRHSGMSLRNIPLCGDPSLRRTVSNGLCETSPHSVNSYRNRLGAENTVSNDSSSISNTNISTVHSVSSVPNNPTVPNNTNGPSDPTLVSDSCDYLECRLYRVQDCAICLESYASRGTILMALPCAHHFHKACVLSWLRRGHAQCPVCRWPAYKQKYDFSY